VHRFRSFLFGSLFREQGQPLRGGKDGISKFFLQTSKYRVLNRAAKQPVWHIPNMTDKTGMTAPKQAIQLPGIS
jgi:hypothetical protein